MKALSHPLRLELLIRLNRAVASPKELAEELGESLGVVSYHIRMLEELGCIELADTKFRRGAVQHFYRPLRRAELSTDLWAEIPQSAREALSVTLLNDAMQLATASLEAGTFDERDDRHVSFTELLLGEDGWAEINEMLDGVIDRALELQAQRADPKRQDGAEPVRSALVLLHFERAPAEGAPAGG